MTPQPNRRDMLAMTAAGVGLAWWGTTPPARVSQTSSSTASSSSIATAPIEALIRRYLGPIAAQLELAIVPAVSGVADQFTISGQDGHVRIAGTSSSALAGGFNWWLKYVAGGHISWAGVRLDTPSRLPAPAVPITRTTPHRIRLYGNPCWLGYTSPYWGLDRWLPEIDYYAVSAFNHVTFSIGHELVYYHLLRDYGYGDAETRKWIALPAHQPWWLMDNISGFDGAIPMDLMRRRAALGRQVMDHLRALGISPVVPAFMGFVPTDFATRHSGADVVQQGTWGGMTRPALLNPTTSLFTSMAADYYRYQAELFGSSGVSYFGDFFQEGGELGDIDLSAAATATQQAMQQASPGALWMLQAWQANPRQEFINGLDTGLVFVLDYQADVNPYWTSTDAFWGAPWTWGTISNAGGNTMLYGRLPAINTLLPAALDSAGRGNLSGVHFAPEGADTNPVLPDFLADMVWRGDASVDLGSWITAYAARRYGADDPNTRAAWALLLATAYGVNGNSGNVDTAPDSLFNAQPSLAATTANVYGATTLPYDPAQMQVAWSRLVAASGRFGGVDTYRYDLLDVTRQILDNASRTLLPLINAAYLAGDRSRFGVLTDRWSELMRAQDRLLGTDTRFLLGTWLGYADQWATASAERELLDYNARDIITAWALRDGYDNGLHDYANRDLNGLVGDYYLHRWQLYFDSLDTALRTGASPATIDWYAVADAWCRQGNRYPTTPRGDTCAIARQVGDDLLADPMFVQVTASPTPVVVAASATVTVTVTVTNSSALHPAEGVRLAVSAPSGFTPGAPAVVGDLAPGGTATAVLTVGVPAGLAASSAMDQIWFTITAAFDIAGQSATSAGYTSVLSPSPVRSPYRTVAFTDAAFGEHGDTFAIYTAGADMWGATNEFAAIYLPAALAVGANVTTRVTAQADTEQWARAGIVVRDDLTTNGSPGYVDLALTPSNGAALSYDSNGDGEIDSMLLAAGFAAPCYLRLTRTTADTYTGECSTDGTTWTTVGTVTAPGAATVQDVGLAADSASTTPGLERFEGLTVRTAP